MIVKIQLSGLFQTRFCTKFAQTPLHDGRQRGLARMVYNFFDQKTGSGVDLNEVVAQTIHKPVIKKLKRRKLYSRFKYNIQAADLTKMGSLSSTNRGVNYLLCDHI